MELFLFLGSLFAFLFVGIPISMVLVLCSIVLMWHSGMWDSMIIPSTMLDGANNYPLMAIPFFVFAGEIMAEGGLSKRVVQLAQLMYITFFGAIEAFYWKKHIAVDMFVDMFSGMSRKCIEILAILLTMGALGLLLDGGITYVLQTIDTNSVATNVNMAFINSTLPIMAFTAILICLRDLIALVRRPASSFVKATEEEKIEQEISKEL